LTASVDFGLLTFILRMQPRLFNPELAQFLFVSEARLVG
jgi:hypothetical protein